MRNRGGSSVVVRGAVRKPPTQRSGAPIIAPTMASNCLDLHAMRVDRRPAGQREKFLELQRDDGVEGQTFAPTIRWS